MKLFIAGAAGLVAGSSLAFADDTYVVPTAYQATAGTGAFLGPLANAPRTYQLLIHADQLTGLVGKQLTGMTWRLLPAAAAAWPAATVNYTSYDVYLSGSVDPANRSLTFANNVVGTQTQVRSGALSIPITTFSSGASPNAFGMVIPFTQGWTYTGGNVLVEIRHTGFTGTSSSVDAITTAISGYGTQFSACWMGSYTGVSGMQGNFAVTQFTATSTTQPCYANCDGSTSAPVLTANDFQCFLNQFAAGESAANCDGSTNAPTLTANDFQCFLNAFAAGCS